MKIPKIIFNTFAFIQGYTRYRFYYNSKLRWLLPTYIYEQIMWRIGIMDIKCFEQGSCKICGCDTTALQMANKACPKPCYPKMMDKKVWNLYKQIMNINITQLKNNIR